MLVIHIGTHKTGTSSLQSFLSARADALDLRGVHYLRSGRAAGKAHHELAWGVREHRGTDLSAWNEVRAELAANSSLTSVISSEAFWFTEPAGVKAQLGDLKDIRIVMYLRRQDKYLQSLYKQTVAGGRKLSFREWREKFQYRGDYLSVVQKWTAAFGKEAVTIRPYERAGKTIDVVADFVGLLDLDETGALQRKKIGRNNPSPRRELMEMIRAFNQLEVNIDRNKFFYEVVARNEAYVRSNDLLTFEESVALLREFEVGNRELIEESYHDPEPLFPALTRTEQPTIWSVDSDEYFALLVDMMDTVWKTAIASVGDDRRGSRKEAKLRPKRNQHARNV